MFGGSMLKLSVLVNPTILAIRSMLSDVSQMTGDVSSNTKNQLFLSSLRISVEIWKRSELVGKRTAEL